MKIGLYITVILIAIGKISGFLKDVSLTYFLGVNFVTDALFLALAISSFLYISIYNTINVDFISSYKDYKISNNREGLLGTIIIYISLTLFVSFIGIFFSEDLVLFFYAGHNKVIISEATSYVEIMALGYLFSTTVAILNSRLIYLGKTNFFYITSIVNNTTFIIGLLFFYSNQSLNNVLIFGIVSWAILVILSLFYSKIKWDNFCLLFKSRYNFSNFGNVLYTMIFVLFDSLALIYLTYKLSGLNIGQLSYFNLSSKVLNFFLAGLLLIVSTHLAPIIVKNINDKNLNQILNKFSLIAVVIMIPFVCLISYLSPFIIDLIFNRGKISEYDLNIISNFFAIMIWLFPVMIFKDVIARLNRSFNRGKNNYLSTFILIFPMLIFYNLYVPSQAITYIIVYICSYFAQSLFLYYSLYSYSINMKRSS